MGAQRGCLRRKRGLQRLTDHSSGRWSDGCGQAARSGSGGDLSSGESKFLRKRNEKKGGVWML
jgi:hypothetical protein